MSSFRTPLRMKNSIFDVAAKRRNASPQTLSPGSEDRRIQIVLHHNGISTRGPLIGQRKREVEEFLTDIWNQFGKVVKTYYYPDLRKILVTFQSKEQAFFSLASLKDPIELSVAIQGAIGADRDRASLARQLFVTNEDGGFALSASFAIEETIR